MIEEVILVDVEDRPIGVMQKMEAHRNGGRLHRALSVFVSNPRGELLIQRRAFEKYHFGGLWSNTCCTHPRPGELTAEAAGRRLEEEMGVRCDLEFRFVFEYEAACESGLIEKEIDHVFTGVHDGPVALNPLEVCDFRWIRPEQLLLEVEDAPELFTPWMRLALPVVLDHLGSVRSR